MESKWFYVDEFMDEFKDFFMSTAYPEDLDEAFDKTYEKWHLISQGLSPALAGNTCGLCNWDNRTTDIMGSLVNGTRGLCRGCPIALVTGYAQCINTNASGDAADLNSEEIDEMILFLHLVEECWEDFKGIKLIHRKEKK